jgi:hypothetical protein
MWPEPNPVHPPPFLSPMPSPPEALPPSLPSFNVLPSVTPRVTCCNDEQWFFLFTVSCYLLAGYLLWHSVWIKPFKLFTVFLHELSHAIAVWCCCGHVTGIEVQVNEGGLTQYEFHGMTPTRVWWSAQLITPAGYLGSTIWGCAILIASADHVGMEVSSVPLSTPSYPRPPPPFCRLLLCCHQTIPSHTIPPHLSAACPRLSALSCS